jgi:hypothetical protein
MVRLQTRTHGVNHRIPVATADKSFRKCLNVAHKRIYMPQNLAPSVLAGQMHALSAVFSLFFARHVHLDAGSHAFLVS